MRSIPVQLLDHKRGDSTTLCQLIRIETRDGEAIGMTTLDRDVVYNDGKGELVYRAPIGFQPASIYSASDAGVDNTEFQALVQDKVVPEYDLELTEERVNAGVYDYAKFWVYEVNFEDLTQGHWVVMHGTLGEMKSVDGISLFGELRSIMSQFRKPVCQLDSLKCRARFGSQPGEERFPCGFDASVLWQAGTVDSVGPENTRTFYDATLTEPEDFFVPGVVRWLTGKNAGFVTEVEHNDPADGHMDLAFPTPYPIEPGDTYERRRDCTKVARDDNKGCRHWFGAEWVNRFRGEPDIPVGDAGTLTTPGAGVGPGSGGSTFNIYGQQFDVPEE